MNRLLKHSRTLAALAALALSISALVGCTASQGSAKSANLVYVNWAEGVAYTHLAKVVLEDKMDYSVTITAADVGPAYTSIAQGDKDAYMESWLPVLHADYVEKYKESIVDLGIIYEGTKSGLVVPAYVTIDSIAQMQANKKKFDGKIIGIDAGAGIMKTCEQLIKDYDMDFKLVASSGPAMVAALKKAIGNKEWIAVTGWRPHWKFGRWDLKFLAQSEDKMVWKPGSIHIFGRKDLKTDKPELAQFLSNMKLTDPQLADLMLKVENSDSDVEEVARQWMMDNPDVIAAWIPKAE
jgi:glycine betaine/proline transport system substrate-binding protein